MLVTADVIFYAILIKIEQGNLNRVTSLACHKKQINYCIIYIKYEQGKLNRVTGFAHDDNIGYLLRHAKYKNIFITYRIYRGKW